MIENGAKQDLERQIDLYLNNKLTKQEINELWVEIIQDEYYLDYLKTAATLRKIVMDSKGSVKPAPVRTLSGYIKYSSAAAVILLVGLFGVTMFLNNKSIDLKPVSSIEFDGTRSINTNADPTPLENTIQQAYSLAGTGKVEEAISLLDQEYKNQSDAANKAKVGIALGAIYYNTSNFAASADAFLQVTLLQAVPKLDLEAAYWYLGNAYFQMDKYSEAKVAFQKSYDLDGAYRRIAKTYIDVLTNSLD